MASNTLVSGLSIVTATIHQGSSVSVKFCPLTSIFVRYFNVEREKLQ